MRYWVVSPMAWGMDTTDEKLAEFLKIIEEKKIALVNWKKGESASGKRFSKEVEIGDLIIIAKGSNKKKKCYYAGIVDSNSRKYENVAEQCRSLTNFVNIKSINIPFSEKCTRGRTDNPGTIYELDPGNPHDKKVIDTVMNYINKNGDNKPMKEYAQLLFSHYQLILTGAPGTGKTYMAKEIARSNISEGSTTQLEFVQFHPSFDYTDFIEGLKPVKGANLNLVFELKNGIFKKFCRRAGVVERILFDTLKKEKNKKDISSSELKTCASELYIFLGDDEDGISFWKEWLENKKEERNVPISDLPKFFFIIDEINRADLSRVFGEIFYALEPDYRGVEGTVTTQYASLNTIETFFVDKTRKNDKFFIPSNVYIIGTMNDIDRSVESFDFALRRRFVWQEIKADEKCFETVMKDMNKKPFYEEALIRYKNLNDVIAKIEMLGESYNIGPAYFRKLDMYSNNGNADWDQFWNNHLELLLKEYLRSRKSITDDLNKLKAAYDNKNTQNNSDNS